MMDCAVMVDEVAYDKDPLLIFIQRTGFSLKYFGERDLNTSHSLKLLLDNEDCISIIKSISCEKPSVELLI